MPSVELEPYPYRRLHLHAGGDLVLWHSNLWCCSRTVAVLKLRQTPAGPPLNSSMKICKMLGPPGQLHSACCWWLDPAAAAWYFVGCFFLSPSPLNCRSHLCNSTTKACVIFPSIRREHTVWAGGHCSVNQAFFRKTSFNRPNPNYKA